MSEIKLSADSGGGTTSLKGPASTTGNAALTYTLPNATTGGVIRTTTTPGAILQVQQCVLTDVSSSSTKESWIDIVGKDQNNSGSIFCVKITPASTSNKILFTTSINLGSSNANSVGLGLYRDSTALAIGDASTDKLRTTAMFYQSDTNVNENIHMAHLDSPNSTSELTYKVKVYCYNEDAFYINRSGRDYAGAHYDYRTSSSLTVMEVAG